MGSFKVILVFLIFGCCSVYECYADFHANPNPTAQLTVHASETSPRRLIPKTLFGVFFEEINHAGAGGLWAELVNNRGFEAKEDPNTPSNTPPNIFPWSTIGDALSIILSTDRSSLFERNKVALKVEVLCEPCLANGVGFYNPGFWGMNIEEGKTYKVVFYVRSSDSINVHLSLTSMDGLKNLATTIITTADGEWRKQEFLLVPNGTDHNSRLQFLMNRKGVIWFDQVSVMPVDTHEGHGFRKDLFKMLADIKPRFIRFPGGCFVEGVKLGNSFQWKDTIGPWEERPGHFGDVWKYWTDDGLGYFEYLQLAEDLGASPVWVINNGISHEEEIATVDIGPWVKDALDSIEFARGNSSSEWGSKRVQMGHPKPFDLRYMGIGNEDCGKTNYEGNYKEFYDAIKKDYPDIKIISNCDGSSKPLNHNAELYDYHIYTSASDMFSKSRKFDTASRDQGPKAFVSEYAVKGTDAGTDGSFIGALAEAGFLIGIERNSDVVEMASYAPLFVNFNDRRWSPDAIVFDSWQVFESPSYWMQKFFKDSSGATLLDSTLETTNADPNSLIASAIICQKDDLQKYLQIKIVNFGSSLVNLRIKVDELGLNWSKSKKYVYKNENLMDGNSFAEPRKVIPAKIRIEDMSSNNNMDDVVLDPYSINSFDILMLL